MSEADDDLKMMMHKTVCPDCESEFYARLPEDDLPVEKNIACPSCDVEFDVTYKEADDPDVMFKLEVTEIHE